MKFSKLFDKKLTIFCLRLMIFNQILLIAVSALNFILDANIFRIISNFLNFFILNCFLLIANVFFTSLLKDKKPIVAIFSLTNCIINSLLNIAVLAFIVYLKFDNTLLTVSHFLNKLFVNITVCSFILSVFIFTLSNFYIDVHLKKKEILLFKIKVLFNLVMVTILANIQDITVSYICKNVFLQPSNSEDELCNSSYCARQINTGYFTLHYNLRIQKFNIILLLKITLFLLILLEIKKILRYFQFKKFQIPSLTEKIILL